MAKKKEENTKDVELTQEEKAALDVQTKAAKGEKPKDKYKLKDPSCQYSEAGFTLSGDQSKELPENPSKELLARIRSGFIVKA